MTRYRVAVALALLAFLAACAPQTAPGPGATVQGAPPAASDPKVEARRLWQQGADAKHRGDLDGARAAWRKAAAVDPGNAAIQASLAELDEPAHPAKPAPSSNPTPVAQAAAPVPAGSWAGRCVGVTDGDTIKVMHDGREVKIRLARIDAPEKSQAFGQRAKQFTSDLVFGKDVVVTPHDTDRYGRTVADVTTPDGRNVNAELVSAGLAWWYRQYARGDTDIARRETEAKAARRGLWTDPAPVAPWDFRHEGRASSGSAPAPAPQPRPQVTPQTAGPTQAPAGVAYVYVTASGKKYHSAGCRSLHGGSTRMSKADAEARGYTACKTCGGG